MRGVKHMIMGVLTLLLILNPAHSANKGELPKMLLDLFGSQCKSVGSYSQSALAHTQSLISMFESLQDDPDCSQVSGLINHLNIFQQQLSNNSPSNSQYQVLELERLIEDLTLAMGTETDPALLADIASELSLTRLELISANSYDSVYNNVNGMDRQQDGYYYVASSLKNLFQNIPNMQKCSNKLGLQSVQMMGNALAAGSFFVNPALSVAMSGVSAVITTGLEAVFKMSRTRRITRLNEVQLPTALSCSSEVLTNLYCETLRAEKVVKKYADLEEDDEAIWKGIPIIFREMKPLIEWLELVRAGSPASDSFDAQRRLEIMELDSLLNELKQKVDGFISDTDREISDLNINLENYIYTKIDKLNTLLKQAKPVVTLNGNDFLPFRLLGFSSIPRCDFQGRQSPCNGLQNLRLFHYNGTGNPGYKFSLKDWTSSKENFKFIYREARSFVNQQLSRIINEDQETVLTQAYEGYTGKWSPFEIVEDLYKYADDVKVYLNKNNEGGRYSPQLLNIESSQVILKEVSDLLKEWRDEPNEANPTVLNEKAGKILSTIYTKLNLKTGDRFLMERVKGMVRWDIIGHMDNGEFDDQLTDIIRFSNSNIISDITAYKLFDLQDMINDINNAKSILKSTMSLYFEEMNKPFQRAIQLIEEEDLEEEVKAKLCIHLLSSKNFKSRIRGRKLLKKCRNIKLSSVFSESGIDIDFNDYIDSKGKYTKPFEERVCLYNEFMRKVKIREQFDKD
ncbi:MAG: hypothetical protein KC493_12770 [Bacteriovoracaceae bacterium]|nr:hypothetical protein [Bacteriovoracaceae bacterium]